MPSVVRRLRLLLHISATGTKKRFRVEGSKSVSTGSGCEVIPTSRCLSRNGEKKLRGRIIEELLVSLNRPNHCSNKRLYNYFCCLDQDILTELERARMLVFTPSREIGGKRMVCYDDRYILRLASELDGVVVSNDNYRDLANESPAFRSVVQNNILMYSFVNDRYIDRPSINTV